MAEMKIVKREYRGPDNLKVRKFKLAIRNVTNKVMGQDPLIAEYTSLLQHMANASDEMGHKSKDRQKQILDAMRTVTGGEWVTDGVGFWEKGEFNPYKPFQKKLLRSKIAQMRRMMTNLGIDR